ncbi:nucleotide pyrophosphohydrolase [Syntrophomonas wolfei]|uniref:nucleotide pyrophosphohydrolase n=1 Tax=Syntrophomonas wolfei TaxID=863 RepID=UPI00077346E9|nr:nucleotide pyrophosphohydrolase [Syntrophomonas wolfei]
MGLNDWQKKIDEYMRETAGYYQPLVCLAALSEEVGELAREINHKHGIKKKRTEEQDYIAEEMGDVLFTLICLANQLDVDLNSQLETTVTKWWSRQQHGK